MKKQHEFRAPPDEYSWFVFALSLTHHSGCVLCDSSAEWGCVCTLGFAVQRVLNKILSVSEYSRWCYHEEIITIRLNLSFMKIVAAL